MQEVRCPQCHSKLAQLDQPAGTIAWMGSIVWKDFKYSGLLTGVITCRSCGELVPVTPPKEVASVS